MPALTRPSAGPPLQLLGFLAGLFIGLGLVASLGGCAAKDPRPPERPTLVQVDAGDDGKGAFTQPTEERDEDSSSQRFAEEGSEALVSAEEAGPSAEAGEAGPSAEAVQEITFDGEDADPGVATQIRSAPKRPTLPSFRLFGTRAGDGP